MKISDIFRERCQEDNDIDRVLPLKSDRTSESLYLGK